MTGCLRETKVTCNSITWVMGRDPYSVVWKKTKPALKNTLNVHFTKCHFIWKLTHDIFFLPLAVMHKANIFYGLNEKREVEGRVLLL